MNADKPQIMWFIWHPDFGLYVGGDLTRRAAIERHCYETGRDWAYNRRKGDRAVKCMIVRVVP